MNVYINDNLREHVMFLVQTPALLHKVVSDTVVSTYSVI